MVKKIMGEPITSGENISFEPLTRKQWKNFEVLFGKKGACGGCWCMHWRLSRSEFERTKGEGNKQKMKALIDKGEVPGILMYVDKKVAGWCAVTPRENYPVLENSRILKKIDAEPVWSIVCFFIDKNYRRRELTPLFLEYVVQYCKKKGAKLIEGYPLDVSSTEYPAVFAFTGFYSTFRKAGFIEVARRSSTRPLMRLKLK